MNERTPIYLLEGTDFDQLCEYDFVDELIQVDGFFKKNKVAFVGIYITKNENINVNKIN